jgi:hypothetical protein
MLSMTQSRFELRRVTSCEWIIVDRSRSDDDPERTVACIYALDEFECDVVWLRDLNLPVAYMTPADVLEDVVRVAAHRRRTARTPVSPRRPDAAVSAVA